MASSWRDQAKVMCFIPLVVVLSAWDDCELFSGGNPGGVTETPAESGPFWDSDEDGISTITELNEPNWDHSFDTTVVDFDPTIAHGAPSNGWLEGGLNLCDTSDGCYRYNPQGKSGTDEYSYDDWGTLALLNMIEGAGRAWRINGYSSAKIGMGDLSLMQGGTGLGHTSHENGLDVDIRYVRNDGQQIGLNIASVDSVYYDESLTWALLDHLISQGNVCAVFVDTLHCNLNHIGYSFITHWPGHSDHFHVRIVDPDGTGN